jgi:hypothetical protein
MPYRYTVHRTFNTPKGFVTPATAAIVPNLPRPLRDQYIERGHITEHHYAEPETTTTEES